MSAVGEIVVRSVTPADFDAVGKLTIEAYRADGQLDGDHGYDKVLADVAGRADSGEILVAADEAGMVLGAVLFVLPGTRFAELAGPGEAEFRMLAVHPRAQRQGVGEMLVRACVAKAQGLGASALMIYTRNFSHGAHRLYDRVGFVRVPERDWTPLPGVDLLAMRLELGGHT